MKKRPSSPLGMVLLTAQVPLRYVVTLSRLLCTQTCSWALSMAAALSPLPLLLVTLMQVLLVLVRSWQPLCVAHTLRTLPVCECSALK